MRPNALSRGCALLWAALPFVFAPPAASAQVEVPAQADGSAGVCHTGRITRVAIRNGDVFNTGASDPGVLRWALNTANVLHIRTTRSFIGKELLFEEGDCFDPFLLSESRRLLDGYGFLRRVRITSEPDGPDGVAVFVETEDEWSTQIDMGWTYDSGLNLEKFQATETNFLGNGVRAEVTSRHRREDRSKSFSLSSPRLWGRADGHLAYGVSAGGNSFDQSFSNPFVGETTQGSLLQSYSRSTGYFPYAAEGADGYSHILVPVARKKFELAVARRYGEPGSSTIIGLGFDYDRMRLGGLPEFVFGGDFDGSTPSLDELPTAAQRQLRSQAASRVSLYLGRRRIARYVEMEGLDAVRDVQSVGMGYFVGLSVGRSIGVFAADSLDPRDTYARLHLNSTREVGPSLVSGGFSAEASDTPEGWQNLFVGAELATYTRASWLPNQTFFFRTSAAAGWRTYTPFQLTLGGRDGVRSLLDDEFPGGRRVVMILEDRIRLDWPNWNALDLGVTVFGDAGRTWAGDAPFGGDSPWYGSVGFGLRLGFPRGTRNIWRPDIVFPIGPGDRSPVFRVTFELNRLRSGLFTGKLVRSERFSRGPERF